MHKMMSAILQIHSTQCTVHILCIHIYHVYLAIFHLCEKKMKYAFKILLHKNVSVFSIHPSRYLSR